MDDHAIVIEQHPARSRSAFDAERSKRMEFQLLLDLIGNCFHLPLIVGSSNDKIIGEKRNGTRVQQQDIRAFFVGNQIQNQASERNRFQVYASTVNLIAILTPILMHVK